MVQRANSTKKSMSRRRSTVSALTIAKQALRGVNKIKKQIEHKYKDTTTTDVTVANSGIISQLFTIAQGDDDITRTGDKCYLTRMELNTAFLSLAGMLETCTIRYVIIKVPEGVVPLISNVFESTSTISHYKKDSVLKYKVLSDNYYRTGVGTTNNPAGAGLPTSKIIRRKYKLGWNYDDDGTNLEKGTVWSILLHDGTTEQLYWTTNCRVHFTDM